MRLLMQLSRKQRLLLVGGFLVVALLLLLGLSPSARALLSFQNLQASVERSGPYGALVFIAIYATAAICFVPATPFMVAAGLLFGTWAGFWYLIIADLVAASVSFGLARTLGRPIIERFAQLSHNPLLQYEERLTKRHGWVVGLVLRVIPLFPFPVVNYGLGLTSMRFTPYLIGTFLGVMPATIAYTFFGSAIAQLQLRQIAYAVLGLLFVMSVSWYLKFRHNKSIV